MEFKDYYTTLGVTKTATEAEIRKAYRKLARKHHPDVNQGDKAAEAKFKEINEGNEVLGDPEKRQKYDELGANWREHEQAGRGGGQAGWGGGQAGQGGGPFAGGGQAGPGGGPFAGGRPMTQEEMHATFGSDDPFSDFFHAFFEGQSGTRARRDTRPRRGHDLEQAVTLTLEEVFTGATRRVSVTGGDKTRTVDIRIPAGVKEGARVRATGEGGAGPSGGASGDLYLAVHIDVHPRFERRDQDLYVRVPVPITTAVLGGDIPVPALSGSTLHLKLPELTSSGQVFRLRGHGLPTVGKPDVRGDLYATVVITAPAQLSDEARAHYAALKALEDKRS
jgi:curved DNA-binding protein